MTELCERGGRFSDLLDYWTGDLDGANANRVEAHLFECAQCAQYLHDAVAIGDAIATGMRGAQVQTIVTESMLTALARDGVRMRTYVPEPGRTIPCAIWPEDDLIVTRLRADFSGFEQIELVLARSDGAELSRVRDIPVAPHAGEIIDVVPAARLRTIPSCQLRLVLSGVRGGKAQVIAEYGLEHTGSEA